MSPLGTLHVLLADDNANMREIVSAMLTAFGVGRVTQAENGYEALAKLAQTPADVAIVDFRMSPMDGVAFTHHLRHSSDSPDTELPVIMMTGHSEHSRVTTARDAGVTEFVAKPVDLYSLKKRLEAVILRPRPFIRAGDFYGPDRRRQNLPGYQGPWRRRTDLAEID